MDASKMRRITCPASVIGCLRKACCTCVALAALFGAPARANADLAEYEKALYDDSKFAIAQLEKQFSDGKLDKNASLEIIHSHISPHVNFEAITRRAVGRHWKKASDTEKQQVTAEFRKLLENLFAVAMSKFSSEKIELQPTVKQNDGTLLLPIIVTKGNKFVEMDYIISSRYGQWLVVDLKIEGVSLLANYRRQFNSLIRGKGVKGLIAALKKKNQA